MTTALHPQPCPGDPNRLRWIIPAGLLTVTGPLAAVPAPLAELLADGTLAEVEAEPGAVTTLLGADRGWSNEGPRVRTAMHAALDDPAGWTAAPGGTDCGDDALLHAMAQQLLNGTAGQFARSHGGLIELVGVHDGVVTVRLTGACHGCPAARTTLHQRLEHQLRRRYPALRAVVDASSATTTSTPSPMARLWRENRNRSRPDPGRQHVQQALPRQQILGAAPLHRAEE